jgi:hypothetical protein
MRTGAGETPESAEARRLCRWRAVVLGCAHPPDAKRGGLGEFRAVLQSTGAQRIGKLLGESMSGWDTVDGESVVPPESGFRLRFSFDTHSRARASVLGWALRGKE